MEVPNWLEPIVQQNLAIETNAVCHREEAELRRKRWAVVLGLRPFLDGGQWCVLYGPDIQEGIAGFGESPEKAIDAFDVAMRQAANAKLTCGERSEPLGAAI